MTFEDFLRGLMDGDFSRLAPLFAQQVDGAASPVMQWFEQGKFAAEREALLEAFTCACFNGYRSVAEYLLAKGVEPSGGIRTGLNAFHWAANRGQLSVVDLLVAEKCPLETFNSYGGTVLGCAVWSAIHEPKPDHLKIIEALLNAGADVKSAEFPTGDATGDDLLRHHRACGRSMLVTGQGE